jgi:hypothetical protein
MNKKLISVLLLIAPSMTFACDEPNFVFETSINVGFFLLQLLPIAVILKLAHKNIRKKWFFISSASIFLSWGLSITCLWLAAGFRSIPEPYFLGAAVMCFLIPTYSLFLYFISCIHNKGANI